MPLFKLPFEANFPINTPLAGQAQPPTERSAAGTWAGAAGVAGVATGGGTGVAGVAALAGVPAGRVVTVVLLDGEDELVTTVVVPPAGAPERPSKRIACPTRMV
ncbi:hypothetical protein D3C77_317900 [compost metagenome]